jgi:2'-hydroxyisoflavone reductase
MDRRRFIERTFGASAAFALALPGLRATHSATPKTILVLGGTTFLGPAIVEAAVVEGHTVTLFNRGLTNPQLFPFLEKLRGLRSVNASEENWTALGPGARRWDAIIDVWPNDPAIVESAAKLLGDRTSHYLYVSSIAAHDAAGFATPGLTEDAPLVPWNSTVRQYNRNKAESERRLNALVTQRLTIIRPGGIKGARDDTPDLLTWLRRSRDGARHIGPGMGDEHVQLVDVRDVARFILLAIDRSLYGAYNVTGDSMTFREFLQRCNAATRSDAEFVWIPGEFLHAHGLDPDPNIFPPERFPLWRPEPARRGFFQISNRKATTAGWSQRPFVETALDYLWWFDSLDPRQFVWKDPLAADVERQVLSQWDRHA